MDAVSADEFFRWTASVCIGIDPRYPNSGCLTLLPPRGHARFWVLPGDPAAWPYFSDCFLAGLDPWSDVILWPRAGSWPAGRDAELTERVLGVILRGAGVPSGWGGALRFAHRERDVVVAILFAFLTFGWCTDDDLFVIPDHGRQIIQTDHHGVVHINCGSESRVFDYVAHMAAAGYELPTEPPDATFKWPAWMGPGPE